MSEGRRGGRRRLNREMEFALCLVYVLLRPHQVKGAPALAKLASSFSPRVKCWSHLEAPPRHILTQHVTAPWARLNPHRTSRPGEWDPGASEGSVALGIRPCALAAFLEHFLGGPALGCVFRFTCSSQSTQRVGHDYGTQFTDWEAEALLCLISRPSVCSQKRQKVDSKPPPVTAPAQCEAEQ